MRRSVGLLVTVLALAAPPWASADPIKDQIILAQTQARGISDRLAVRATSTDPTYYLNCHWFVDGVDGGPEVKMGHAALSAAVYTYTHEHVYFVRAVNSINCYLAENGATGGGDTNMGFFGVQLGLVRFLLDPYLSVTVKAQWDAALKAIVDSWRADNNAPVSLTDYAWYTNGNVEVVETLVSYYAKRFNATIAYLAETHAAQRAFMLDPPANAGGGYDAGTNAGLRYLVVPTHLDGRDGQGYLTENDGPGGPTGAGWGHDPYYTLVQDGFLAPWVAVSGDPVAVRTLNPIFNSGLARTDTTTWTLDARGGTRRSFFTPFISSGLFELGMNQGRNDLLPYLQSNWAKVVEHYSSSAGSPGKSRGYGTVLGTAIYSGMKYQMGHP